MLLFLSFLISAIISNPCVPDGRQLARQSEEEFFDYACRIKLLELNKEESEASVRFIKDPAEPLTPYLETLHGLLKEQLTLRMGHAAKEVSRDFLDQKVHRLMKIFLKDKLGLQKPVTPEYDLANRAKWDPHFHGSSLFADHFPKARLYLPNYEEAYAYIKFEHRRLEDRSIFIKKAMEEESFAKVTEVCSSYDKWHIVHAGKRMIPILGHKKVSGAVDRHDVWGYDVCGLEEEDRYPSQKAFFESVQGSKVVRMHMGETIVPAKGREHVRLLLDEAERYYTSSKPLRIGHGTHISIEDMIRVAKKGYYIEACLSSNKRTGILDKRSDYPLGVMLVLGVNVVIGTDGGRLYSTTLPEEYAHAVRNLQKFHAKLKNSDAWVLLPNGDCLCYKHILPLLREENKKRGAERLEEGVTYKQLGAVLDPSVLERISSETLIQNANVLLEACYPSHSR